MFNTQCLPGKDEVIFLHHGSGWSSISAHIS